MRDTIVGILKAVFDILMEKWENKRKGANHEHEFCGKCVYTFEYRTNERLVFIRCKSCRHVHKKRPMTGRELVDMLEYQEQEEAAQNAIAVAVKPEERNGGHVMPNEEQELTDEQKCQRERKRKRQQRFCEDMTQYYPLDKNIQFHLLSDDELQSYVDCYKYDQSCSTCLDELEG